MGKTLVAGILGAGMLLAPLFAADADKKDQMSKDMREAIAFEHFKDAAAARQERMEARHPSVTYSNSGSNSGANRSMEDDKDQGKAVKDPGPAPKKDK